MEVKKMSKEINEIIQMNDGGNNPKSGIFESTLWQLNFKDDSEPRILGRTKMLEYLSKGTSPAKTVHAFKKWEITTVAGTKIRTWVIVYDDKSHTQLVNKDFYSLLTNGHKNKDEEKMKELEESLIKKQNAPLNPAIFTNKITTEEEKEELRKLREHPDYYNSIDENQPISTFPDAVREDYGPNPDATGYEESK